MVLFTKKEREEEYGEELEERPLGKRPRNRDFVDLKPENRKKRKEPKKPWGKKERFFVFFAILATAGVSGLLALSSRSWKLPGLPRVSFDMPSLSLPFFSEETIVIEGRKKDKEKSDKVIDEFRKKTDRLSGVYGFYVIKLGSGFSYGLNEDKEFEPASLNKLPVILGMYLEEESGDLDLDEKYSLKSSDKLSGSGSLYSKPAGTILSYRDLIRYMGKESDNTAYNIGRRILGKDKIERVTDMLGMDDTVVLGSEQKTTPKDIGIFFQRLWWGGLISDGAKNEFFGFIMDTLYEDWVAAGIPEDVIVVHKFGRELHIVNDAGIVFSKNPYVVVIMSKGIVEKEADEVFPELSRIIFEAEADEVSGSR